MLFYDQLILLSLFKKSQLNVKNAIGAFQVEIRLLGVSYVFNLPCSSFAVKFEAVLEKSDTCS